MVIERENQNSTELKTMVIFLNAAKDIPLGEQKLFENPELKLGKSLEQNHHIFA